jgi:hypothetical protein
VPRPRPERRLGRPGRVATMASSPRHSDAPSTAAATAGRVLGTAVARARSSGAPLASARSLGRATGHARRLGRAARAAKAVPGVSPPATTPPRSQASSS